LSESGGEIIDDRIDQGTRGLRFLMDLQPFRLVDLLALSKACIVRRRLHLGDHHPAKRQRLLQRADIHPRQMPVGLNVFGRAVRRADGQFFSSLPSTETDVTAIRTISPNAMPRIRFLIVGRSINQRSDIVDGIGRTKLLVRAGSVHISKPDGVDNKLLLRCENRMRGPHDSPRRAAPLSFVGEGMDQCRLRPGSHFPGAGRLAHGNVEPVPDIDIGDGQNQRREFLLAKLLVGLAPDRIRHRIGAVAEAGQRFRQRQGGPFLFG
jgi:hypothetical protein